MSAKIDSHLQLWDLTGGGYGWLTPDAGQLYQSFRAEQAAIELRSCGVGGAVLVQADDTVADTRAMLDVAASHDWVVGVVGWIPLDDPSQASAQLEEWVDTGHVRGIRHLVHVDPRPDFLELRQVRRSIRGIADAGFTFDVPATTLAHLGQVAELAKDVPGLRIVIDHLGKPPRNADSYAQWHAALARASKHENVVAKLSGLRAIGEPYSAAALSHIWDAALELFGPRRLLWGSDWPITVPDGGYAPTLSVLEELVDTLGVDEQEDIWSRTAAHVYKLGRSG